MKKYLFFGLALWFNQASAQSTANLFDDASRTYSLPTLTKNRTGEVVLYWTEKDANGVSSLFFATSKDAGKTFGDKKLVYADAGLGASKLARPRILFKKDGSMVAVFAHRSTTNTPPPPKPAAEPQHSGHEGHSAAQAPQTARPKRDGQIKFTVSKDGGQTWTSPQPVDQDTAKLVRGFFDAVVLPNDEIAVAYLKDVKGSTKFEERDLRLAITKNGVFQPERLIDPVVCDCCNISLLVDADGALHVYYRDNNDNIRDIAEMVSKDNGATFSKPKILYNDKWQINGCPHSGASSGATKGGNYVAWYSGTQNTVSGFRVTDGSGKMLRVLEPAAKNAMLSADGKQAVVVWEQTNESGRSNVFFSKINGDKMSDNQIIDASVNGQNAFGYLVDGKLVAAYEVVKEDKKTTIQIFAEQ